MVNSLGRLISCVVSSLQERANSVASLMESQIWYPHADSVALWWGGLKKGQWPLPAFLSEIKLSSRSHLDARLFSSSPYATGAFQASTPVLELRE